MVRETYIRNRGRPKRTLDEIIQKDMLVKGLSEEKNRDIAIWRRVIHVADPTLSGIRFTLMMMMMMTTLFLPYFKIHLIKIFLSLPSPPNLSYQTDP